MPDLLRWLHTIGFGATMLLLVFGMATKLIGCGEKPKKIAVTYAPVALKIPGTDSEQVFYACEVDLHRTTGADGEKKGVEDLMLMAVMKDGAKELSLSAPGGLTMWVKTVSVKDERSKHGNTRLHYKADGEDVGTGSVWDIRLTVYNSITGRGGLYDPGSTSVAALKLDFSTGYLSGEAKSTEGEYQIQPQLSATRLVGQCRPCNGKPHATEKFPGSCQ